MWFSGFFFSFCLSWLKCTYDENYRPLIILSGRTCTIGGWLNTFCPTVLHHICSSIQDIFGLTLLCCAHLNRKVAWRSFVGKFCHQNLSSKSVIPWIYSAFKTTGNSEKTRLNHDDVSDLQVIPLERGQSSWFTIPSWVTVQKCISPVGAFFPPEFPVVLNSLKSDFPVLS